MKYLAGLIHKPRHWWLVSRVMAVAVSHWWSITALKAQVLQLSAFADVYYSRDFGLKPKDHLKPAFFVNHNINHRPSVNLATVRLSYENNRFRNVIMPMVGSYATYNLGHEPAILKNFYELYAGFALTKSKNMWLDAGIFESHLGFEAVASAANYTLTRSLVAETVPYYLCGLRWQYQPTSKWLIGGTLANGWQRIRRVAGSTVPAVGSQISYYAHEHLTLSYNLLYGTDDPDERRRWRILHNFYAKIRINARWQSIWGFDVGRQQVQPLSPRHYYWYAPVAIGCYQPHAAWQLVWRAEYFDDLHGVVLNQAKGFKGWGLSQAVNFTPIKQLTLKAEYRVLHNHEPIFADDDKLSRQNRCFTAHILLRLP